MGTCAHSDEPQNKQENSVRKSYWLSGARFTVHASHEDTAGHYDLIEGGRPPGFQASLHRHNRYAEQLYVVEGEWTVWAGKQTAVLHPGDAFAIPAGTAHTVAVSGDSPGRALVVASPSGFARLITEVGTPDEGGETPPSAATDMDLLLRVSAELGDEILGPPGALPY
jgi:quercetin dioxygenase-like cupin family protein